MLWQMVLSLSLCPSCFLLKRLNISSTESRVMQDFISGGRGFPFPSLPFLASSFLCLPSSLLLFATFLFAAKGLQFQYIQVSSWPGAALPHRALHDDIRCWPPTPTICQHAPAHHPTDEDKLRRPQLLCPWTNCVEQSAVRFAVYRHLAEHFQEQTENISV